MKITCEFCGKTVETTNKLKRFCSDKCRRTAHRYKTAHRPYPVDVRNVVSATVDSELDVEKTLNSFQRIEDTEDVELIKLIRAKLATAILSEKTKSASLPALSQELRKVLDWQTIHNIQNSSNLLDSLNLDEEDLSDYE